MVRIARHGDEPVTVVYSDGPQRQFSMFGTAETVQSWRMGLNGGVNGKKRKDYIGGKTPWSWFGNHGLLFLPGMDRLRNIFLGIQVLNVVKFACW